MNIAIKSMLQKYECKTAQDYENALKEIIQEVALVGLWRSKFFEYAAFYGGTALRILFELDRFSEDLDFTLLKPNSHFDFSPYLQAVKSELVAFGFNVEVQQKNKTQQSAVQSAFLKSNTLELLFQIGMPSHTIPNIGRGAQIKIKFEIDTDPPPDFSTGTHYLLNPVPCAIRVVAEQDLFAGKMHALLCRAWKNRVKGRDWYDLIWYISRQIPLNLHHLEMRMRQSGHFNGATLDKNTFQTILREKIDSTNFEEAKKDILPFIKKASSLDLWSPIFFHQITKKISFDQ